MKAYHLLPLLKAWRDGTLPREALLAKTDHVIAAIEGGPVADTPPPAAKPVTERPPGKKTMAKAPIAATMEPYEDPASMSEKELFAWYKRTAPVENVRFFLRVCQYPAVSLEAEDLLHRLLANKGRTSPELRRAYTLLHQHWRAASNEREKQEKPDAGNAKTAKKVARQVRVRRRRVVHGRQPSDPAPTRVAS